MFQKNRPWHRQFKRKPKVERTVNGKVFDSAAEADRYCYLLNLERVGVISKLECQVQFILELPDGTPITYAGSNRVLKYKADFSYVHNGRRVYEEYKGFDDSTSKLRRAVVEALYKIRITVVKKAHGLPGESTPARRKKRISKVAHSRAESAHPVA